MRASPRDTAKQLLHAAGRVVVLTGAGISAESGVPTFRDAGGLWRAHRPEDLATPEAFQRDPELVSSWYAWRRELVRRCQPNPGHRAVAAFALGDRRVDIVTQNVDGLHRRAADEAAAPGIDPARAYPTELHGSLMHDRCSKCGRRTRVDFPADTEAHDAAEAAQPGSTPVRDDARRVPVPQCTDCGGLLRPDVVWFGEALDGSALEAAFEAGRRADVCLVVGTSSLVYPAAGIPRAAVEAGTPVIEVNPEATPLTPHAAVALAARAGDMLPSLLGVLD